MKKNLFVLVMMLLIASVYCSAQNSRADSIFIEKMKQRAVTEKVKNKPWAVKPEKQSLLYQAGDCFQMSGYMQYAAIGTGALAGVVAIIASDKEGDTQKSLRTGAYLIAGFAVAFEFASITYRIKGGRRLKLAASTDGASVALNF